MRTTRVHCSEALTGGSNISLSLESSHHLANVLRLKPDAKIHLFNEQDGEFSARITRIKKGTVEVKIEQQLTNFQSPKLNITLCLGVSRGDRMDFGIQKSVELGVNKIVPFYSEHGDIRIKAERLEKKRTHWQRVAISASEQSGRLDVPEVTSPVEINECLTMPTTSKLVFDPSGDTSLQEIQVEEDLLLVVIGPEGGFSESELNTARQQQCKVANLGPRVLRTETAPVAALAILQHKFGDI